MSQINQSARQLTLQTRGLKLTIPQSVEATQQPDVCSPADSVSSSSFPSPVWSKESPRAPTRELRQQETRPSTAGGAVCPDWGIAHQFAQLPTAAAAEGCCGQLVRPAARPQQAAAAEPTAPPPPPAISSAAAVVSAVVATPPQRRAERLVGQLGQHWEKEARTSAGLSMGAPEVCASPRSAAECRLELTRVEVEWEPEEEAEEEAEEEEEDEEEEEHEDGEESDDIASPAVCCRSVAHSSVQLSDSLCVELEPEEQPGGGAELLAADSGSSRTKAAKSAVRKLRSKIASRIKAAVRACVLRHLMM
ncbi:hypothetical protein PLESTM_001692600 [Pleodorina starrii]|nr:hypothetical protein PLESTM_001692600 [Pleodorina starrii]